MILNRKADFKDIFDTKLTGKPSYDKAKGMIKELVEKVKQLFRLILEL